MTDYEKFLASKAHSRESQGFAPVWMPEFLFGFQRVLTEWSIKLGKCAIFADCGLGKSPMSLTWGENVVRHTNGPVLMLTPLAVGPQMIREGEKFGIEVRKARPDKIRKGINVINYQQIHKFTPDSFEGIILDESSILKSFDGKTRKLLTDFMRGIRYRLLCTATPAPNDFMELGTSSEALGVMGRNQMLGMFFANDGETTQQWRLKGHAKKRFWQWMASWARAVRKPSDLGFDDGDFKLPPLNVIQHSVDSEPGRGFFPRVANTLAEQRQERKQSLRKRCEKVAEVIPGKRPVLVWCQRNDESKLLTSLIDGAVEVTGSDPDEKKEANLNAFAQGQIRVLVTKPSIAGFGLNYQHCADVSYFPTWSHESYYQAIRRCWRFGQKKEVNCHLIHSSAEQKVVSGMLRKEQQSIELYDGICREMHDAVEVKKEDYQTNGKITVPVWLKGVS